MYANIIYTPYLRHDLNYDAYYLQHHGIKGQKWGIRRFQNEDGTLTNAGRKRKGFKERVKGVGQKIKNAPVGTKAGVAGGLLAAKSIKDSLANARAAEELMGVALAKDQVITKTLLHAGKVGAIAALAVIGGHMVHDYTKSNPDKIKKAKDWLGKSRLERAADAAQRDADDLRKHGYKEEADAVQKVADSNRKKANARKNFVANKKEQNKIDEYFLNRRPGILIDGENDYKPFEELGSDPIGKLRKDRKRYNRLGKPSKNTNNYNW